MLADSDRAPSADLTMASNPVADEEEPAGGGLPPPVAPAGLPEVEQEDTNAVVSPTHTDFFLTRIGGAFVALPIAVPYMGLVGALLLIAYSTYHEGEVSPLTRRWDVCIPVGTSIGLLGAFVSLRRATGTGPGRGQLAALGAGEVRISERARRSLGRAHVWLCVLGVLWTMLGLLCLVTAFRVGTRSKLTGRLITAAYARVVFLFGLGCINAALTFFPWWHALKSASALVTDAVAETRQAAERCSPTSPEWEAEVLPRVLGLCDTTLPLLSRGYGLGVATNFLGWWLGAAAAFAIFLEGGTPASAFITVLCVLTPLGVSYDAAAASSDCDLLSDTLNEKRMRGDLKDQAFGHAIRSIELILNNQNTKQGLGFTVGHRVMDLKTLGNIVAAIVGVASTAVPILFSLRPSTVSTGDTGGEVCGLSSLSTPLLATIQGAVAGMGTETCSYNTITLGEIMGA